MLCIAADKKGVVWFGHFFSLTCLLKNATLVRYTPENGLLSKEINQVLCTSKGELWVSYMGKTAKVSRSMDQGKNWEHFEPVTVKGLGMQEPVGLGWLEKI
ncbi:MAG: hypothetical protein A2487_07700 [Candidatus Raymondbacteria bacterium RifOxyC12_full_50_8]|uniref:Photosynthesis system II assembly factor Ycf48/Hcf136-like domain-containing protein n=1 Tax=Candidatus Raymondbacteria bacterium RIFOXYD12_FULL_49_13 TaxID=1817890 RepID=A0A1F7F6F2_UNCRA|nr:MAG: hypothetical protein A2248_13260 [Candidatus Raymondbacteria bacterium RIFOXYA2_FULL_49_16]OGJ96066.1 MAG: hypothetical protein A2350_04700 [Candidatus Raymondbacteria bacterium RifOxyB12_full_50_8]OGJ99307.1 MAG: hypothetical protein A2487_07700 [Candidatus Raymondbacteria bacterium RifOxyC12_full_50_8]OGK02255.1 MAG: hypothetical protein A2519_16375 [Candidatus Raymondbacteria bacterium RIFOXYD12_FULL_49_13]OGP45132.1 MAG: hypothetical protein A2324_12095 [Candidatus Raymondbacteria b